MWTNSHVQPEADSLLSNRASPHSRQSTLRQHLSAISPNFCAVLSSDSVRTSSMQPDRRRIARGLAASGYIPISAYMHPIQFPKL